MSFRFIFNETRRVLNRIPIFFIEISFLALILLGISLLGGFIVMNINKRLLRPIEIDVYLSNGLSKDYLVHLEEIFKSLGGVEKVQFISKTRAKKIFETFYPDYVELVELFPESPFPESFKIVLKPYMRKENWISHFIQKINSVEGVEEVYYPSKQIERANRWSKLLLMSSFSIILFLTFLSLFIHFNTLKFNIKKEQQIRDTISILGASPFSIRLVYSVSGFLIGFSSGIFALILLYLITILLENVTGFQINQFFLFLIPFLGGISGGVAGYVGSGDFK